jgi:phytoene dehydrogenase-like protein
VANIWRSLKTNQAGEGATLLVADSTTNQRFALTASAGAKPDVIVIGGGLGGLSAAIHLRLAGHAVRLYEANDRVGGRANQIERAGFKFDTGPSLLNYPWVFEELFQAAGRALKDYVTLLPIRWGVGLRIFRSPSTAPLGLI